MKICVKENKDDGKRRKRKKNLMRNGKKINSNQHQTKIRLDVEGRLKMQSIRDRRQEGYVKDGRVTLG